jgi:hypothetical protein
MRITLPHRAAKMQVSLSSPPDVSFPEQHYEEYLRQYLVQVRQELAARLIEKLYADGTGKPSKWWMSFQKRRFMNRSLGS